MERGHQIEERRTARVLVAGDLGSGAVALLERLHDQLSPLRRGDLERAPHAARLCVESSAAGDDGVRSELIAVEIATAEQADGLMAFSPVDAVAVVCREDDVVGARTVAHSAAALVGESAHLFVFVATPESARGRCNLEAHEVVTALGLANSAPVSAVCPATGRGVKPAFARVMREAAVRAFEPARDQFGQTFASDVADEAGEDPMLPDPDAPTRCIWPPAVGRTALAELWTCDAVRCDDWPASQSFTGCERARRIVYRAGAFRLSTRSDHRFETEDGAHAAMVARIRRAVRLGKLLHPRIVFSAHPDASGHFWIWRLVPWLPTLASLLAYFATSGERSSIEAVLETYGAALGISARLAANHGVRISPSLDDFAIDDDRLYYVGDEFADGASVIGIGQAARSPLDLLGATRLDEYETYLRHLRAGVLPHLAQDDAARDWLLDAVALGPS